LEVSQNSALTRAIKSNEEQTKIHQIEKFINIPIRFFPRFTENKHHLLNEIRMETGTVITPEAFDNGGSRRFRVIGVPLPVQLKIQDIR
jgi:allantoicase